jgi:hypothetical protein
MVNDSNKTLNNIFNSAIGTLVAELITLPICTLKTVYQNNPTFTILDTYKHIYYYGQSHNKHHSYRGFFQASSPAIISQIISTSSKYSAYEFIKSIRNENIIENNTNIVGEKDNKILLLNNSMNGIIGGLIGSVVTHPFDLWKNFVQRNESYIIHLKNSSKNIKSFISNGLYQGYTGSIAKNIVLYASLFPLLDYYQTLTPHFWLASLGTTLSVSLLIQPFDYYKVVSMANSQGKIIKNPFRGFSLLLARSIPHLFITMSLTKFINNF